ncbi:MAG: hypothetical protein ACFE7R_07535, partial [Candidatus Hodarchaeota archaeon]
SYTPYLMGFILCVVPRSPHMSDDTFLTIDRDLEDVKLQVKQELDTIRGIINTLGYRKSTPHWNAPYQIHRLRRALRIHYLAYKIRDSAPTPTGLRELEWELDHKSDPF